MNYPPKEGCGVAIPPLMLVRMDQAGKEQPPVVDQGHQAAHNPAALKILGSEPSPPPLVLQFIEAVFAVATIPVMLGNRKQFSIQ